MKMGQTSLEFKERSFILDKDKLYYYKKENTSNVNLLLGDMNFSIIPLVNAKLRKVDQETFLKMYQG
jgi:hypothetical protein